MPQRNDTVSDLIEEAVAEAIRAVAPRIQRHLAELAAEELERALAFAGAPAGASRRRSRPRPEELTRWVADNRARRVPTFVIEMTGGLDTKKKIVSRYGANAVFEKGKPLPKTVK